MTPLSGGQNLDILPFRPRFSSLEFPAIVNCSFVNCVIRMVSSESFEHATPMGDLTGKSSTQVTG